MIEEALETMGRHVDHVMREEEIVNDPTGPNERRSPPIVHVYFAPGLPVASERDSEVFWLGREMFKLPHFDDETVKARIADAVETREHLTGEERVDTEYDVTIDESHWRAETIPTETEWVLREIYDCSPSSITGVEWDDISNRERLSGDEYLETYGDEF